MEELETRSNESLEFIIKDCRDAVRAMPENPKAMECLWLANKAEEILRRRQEIAMWRRELKRHGFDPLTGATIREKRTIRANNENPHRKDRLFSAMRHLGWYKRYGKG